MKIHAISNAPTAQPHSIVVHVPRSIRAALVLAFQQRCIAAWTVGAGCFVVACQPETAQAVLRELAQRAAIGAMQSLQLEEQ